MHWPQFRLRTLLLLPVLAWISLIALNSCGADWVGTTPVRLDFHVVDQATGVDAPSATVELYEFEIFDNPPDAAIATGADGRATLNPTIMVYGARSPFKDTEVAHPFYLKVSANGYETAYEELTSLRRNPRQYHATTPAPPIVVRLIRSTSVAPSTDSQGDSEGSAEPNPLPPGEAGPPKQK